MAAAFIVFLFLLPGWVFAQSASAAGAELAPTPPMGWANWNHYFCDYNAQTIRNQADALVSTGMRGLGYKYVIIQECIAPERDRSGNLIVDAGRFPEGMKRLVDYIHARGLKAGIYTDVGPYTCNPKPRYQGSFGHESQDAQTFAAWGMDLVEMDYCNKPANHTGRELYERMGRAIRATGRPMVFYICSWGEERPWEWAQGTAELWRTDSDISQEKNHAEWKNVLRNFESNAQHSAFSAPGSWNDADMLEVGNPGLTAREGRSHFSMWAISAAPLLAGTDLTQMDAATRGTLTNAEVIAVDQDALGAGPMRIAGSADGVQVWVKPLGAKTSGRQAVLLLNPTAAPAKVSVRWSDMALLPGVEVRDLWAHKNLGRFPDGYSAVIPSHGSEMLKVAGEFNWKNGAMFEAEWPGNLRQGGARLLTCGECSQGFGVSIGHVDGKVAGSLTFRDLRVAQAGRYQVELTYVRSGAEDKTIGVRVDDAPSFEKRLLRTGNRVVIPVELAAGENSLTVTYAGDGTVNVDGMRLFR